MIFPLYFVLSLFLFGVHITAVSYPSAVDELYRFPFGTSIASVIVLNNGSLFFTLLTEPSLYRLDPYLKKKPVLVRSFPGHTSLLGIAQLQQKRTPIAVIAGNLSEISSPTDFRFAGVVGTFSIFLLDPSGGIEASYPIPKASLGTGLTALPEAPQYLLASDTFLKVVWRLNVVTGKVDKAITDPGFGSLGDIQVQDHYLYFTPGDEDALGRIRIKSDGTSMGKPSETTIIGYFEPIPIGAFILAPDGSFIISTTEANVIDQREPFSSDGGGLRPLLQKAIAQYPTATALDPVHRNLLYVVSAGKLPGYSGPDNGGQILRIRLDVPQPDLPYSETLSNNGYDLGVTSG